MKKVTKGVFRGFFIFVISLQSFLFPHLCGYVTDEKHFVKFKSVFVFSLFLSFKCLEKKKKVFFFSFKRELFSGYRISNNFL